MRNKLVFAFLLIWAASPVFPCTNLIVTKGASKDGSTFLAYTNDGEWLYKLDKTPAMDHKPGDSVSYTSRSGIEGKIPQIGHTYAVLGFQMNEHQVAVGETTFTGREELWNHENYLEYWHLMRLALERASTAKEAIQVMTSLAETYGYGSEGESFSITDPNEAWILEMIGTGNGGKGAVWVARKIPDGYVCAHANMSRIGEFPLYDPENCLYSKNVISFAIEKGYYNPKSGETFRFNQVYDPPSPDRLKYCESRVWSLFRRISPSLNLSPDYHRGIPGAERYPLWILPDEKLELKNVFSLLRDHYEDTEYDMTKGIAAGPFGSPNRWRPLSYTIDSTDYSWERPISTYNTAFSFVAQARNWMPNNIGGLVWFGVDDTYFTCYTPIYNSVTKVDNPFAVGDLKKFSWESMWWVFNFVSNFSNLKYAYMVKDVKKVQEEMEQEFFIKQQAIEFTAVELKSKKRIAYLTNYSNEASKKVHQRWIELAEALVTKYNDGYIKNENGHPESVGYPQEWYKTVNTVEKDKDKYKIRKWKNSKSISHKPF